MVVGNKSDPLAVTSLEEGNRQGVKTFLRGLTFWVDVG